VIHIIMSHPGHLFDNTDAFLYEAKAAPERQKSGWRLASFWTTHVHRA